MKQSNAIVVVVLITSIRFDSADGTHIVFLFYYKFSNSRGSS